MVRLEYRNYKQGDEFGMAKLHNLAFQSLGGGILRTANLIKYRYMQRPGFDPKEINLVEDTDKGIIVGQIMGTKDTIYFDGDEVNFLSINDVATLPGYGGRGIAKSLMKMANQFADEKQLKHAILSAAPDGFPRSKIYLKDGYFDYLRPKTCIHFSNAAKMVQRVPIMMPGFLGLYLKQTIPLHFAKSFLKSRKRILPELSSLFVEEIRLTEPQSESYRKTLNKAAQKEYDGITVYTKELWKWAKLQVPIKSLEPTLLALNYTGKQIGGLSLRIHHIYSMKFNFKVPIGVVYEVFMDNSAIPKHLRSYAYLELLIKSIETVQSRGGAISFMNYSENDSAFDWALKKVQYHAFGSAALMIKSEKYNQPPNPEYHRKFSTNPNLTWGYQ